MSAGEFEPMGDGHSIVIAGRPVSLGDDVRVVLWNEPVRYGDKVRALWKRGLLPSFNFYGKGNPFAEGAAAAGKRKFVRCALRPARIGDVEYQVPTVFWTAKGMESADVVERRRHITMLMLHHDVALSSLGCYQTLCKKKFSVHLMLDYDGTLYQTVDLVHGTAHGDHANGYSVGIEINNYDAWKGLRGYGLTVAGAKLPDKGPSKIDSTDKLKEYLAKVGTVEDLPGGRRAFRVPCSRGVVGGGEVMPARCEFSGFVEGKQAIWKYDAATKKAIDAYKEAKKEAAAKPGLPAPPEPPRRTRGIEEGWTGVHLQADYSEAQHRTLMALADTLTARGGLGIKRGVFGGPEHLQRRFELPAGAPRVLTTLEDVVSAWPGGITSHASIMPGSRWDPGPALRWDVLSSRLGVGAPPPPPAEAPAKVGTRHHAVVEAVAATADATAVAKVRAEAKVVRPEDASSDPAEARRDRLDGKAESIAPVIAAQFRLRALHALGYIDVDPGKIDGVLRVDTVTAVKAFQAKVPLPITGRLDKLTRDALRDTYLRELARHDGAMDGGD
jgi:hypothetical protein